MTTMNEAARAAAQFAKQFQNIQVVGEFVGEIVDLENRQAEAARLAGEASQRLQTISQDIEGAKQELLQVRADTEAAKGRLGDVAQEADGIMRAAEEYSQTVKYETEVAASDAAKELEAHMAGLRDGAEIEKKEIAVEVEKAKLEIANLNDEKDGILAALSELRAKLF